MKPVHRFIEYRKALWFSEKQYNLQELIEAAWMALPTSEQRVVIKKDQTCTMGMGLRTFDTSIGFQCCRFVDRQPVGVVPMRGGPAPILTEQIPEEGHNFLSADFFAFVDGNDVISLNAGMNGAALRSFLHGLFPVAVLDIDATKFDLVQQAAPNVLRKIQAGGGVESIQFDIGITEATASLLEDEKEPKTLTEQLAAGLGSLLDMISKPRDRQGIKESTGSMRVTLNVPKGEMEAVQRSADRLAVDLVEDDEADDFLIGLRNGETIRRRQMSTKKSVPLQRSANSFVEEDVYSAMSEFLKEVRASGLAGV